MAARDPTRALVRLLARLEERAPHVTLADLEREAARRRTRSLPADRVAALVEEGREAVARGGGVQDEAMYAALAGQLLAGTPDLDVV